MGSDRAYSQTAGYKNFNALQGKVIRDRCVCRDTGRSFSAVGYSSRRLTHLTHSLDHRLKPLLTLLPAEIQTTRLRRFSMADRLAFHVYRSDSDLARFQGWSPMSIEDAGAFVRKMSQVTGLVPGQWTQLAIAQQSTDTLIGDVGLFYDENESEAEVGFTLSKSAQGCGHATRAVKLATQLIFAASSAKYVRGVPDVRNTASIRTLERADFVIYGARQAEFKGELCNELIYEFCRAVA